MALSIEDMQLIESEIFSKADEKYVHIKDCNVKQTGYNEKFAKHDKRIGKQEDFIGGLKKYGWIVISILTTETIVSIIGLLK